MALKTGTLLASALLGAATAAGGTLQMVALALAVSALAVALLTTLKQPLIWQIEIPVVLVLLSHVVWRIRDADELTASLDPAGLFRLNCLGLAFLLACSAVLQRQRAPIASVAVTLYVAYAASTFIAVPLSVEPLLTLYRGIDLAVGLLVVVAAVRCTEHGLARVIRVVFYFLVALVASVWVGLVVSPDTALISATDPYGATLTGSQPPFNSPIPIRLQGVLPVISSDSAGFFGGLLFLWCAAMYGTRETLLPQRALIGLGGLGLVTALLAQYRTGYVMIAVGLAVLGAYRRQFRVAAAGLGAVVIVGVLIGWTPVDITEILLRGESAQTAAQFTGRTVWWDRAIDVWSGSPVFGKGLLTASRFEVLAPLGFTETATIHSAWIEALLGAGVAGLALLAASVLSVAHMALRRALVLPLVLLSALLVRSLANEAFEVAGFSSVLFLVVAIWVAYPAYSRTTSIPPDWPPRSSEANR